MPKHYHFRDWDGRILATREVADDGRIFFTQSIEHTAPSTFLYEAQNLLDGSITVACRTEPGKGVRWRLWEDSGRFHMHDAETYGTHSLDVASTTAERLAAHWRGFIGVE